MAHRILFALKTKSFDIQMDGVVQADETFMGGKNKNRHADKKVEGLEGRSVKTKTPVFGMTDDEGNVSLQVIPNTQARTNRSLKRW